MTFPTDTGSPCGRSTLFTHHHWLITFVKRSYWYLWSFVGLVSIYDAWLVVSNRDVILDFEKNPVGLMLIGWDPHELSYFMLAKFAGTAMVMAALYYIHRLLSEYRNWIMGGVASYQAWLLWYLSFAAPRT